MNNEIEIEKALEVLSIQIPFKFYKKLEFLFKDNDRNNWDAKNVTYKFSDGTPECPFHPGYFYIPGFSRYVINLLGEILRVSTSRKMKWQFVKPAKASIRGGYATTTIVSDCGIPKLLSRHRALCLTFKDYTEHPDNFVINHKNGIGGDDWLDNLEFCTYGQNTQHAYDMGLYSNKTVAVDAWNWITEDKQSFSSIQKCADTLGLNVITLTSRLRYSNGKKYPDGWRVKKASDEWDTLNGRIGQTEMDRAVACRNVLTNATIIAGSINEAGQITGCNIASIRVHCFKKFKIPLHSWQFRYLEEFSGWPKYNDKQLAIFKDYPFNPSNGIEVYDAEKNETLFFTGLEKAANYFKLSPITISKMARYEMVREKRFHFKLVRVREEY